MSRIPQHLLGKYAVLLFDSKGLFSTLIRWQTRGTVSHAAILLPDGSIIEAMQGRGVQIIWGGDVDWTRIRAFEVDGMSKARWLVAEKWATGHVGEGYDYLAILRFLTRRRVPPNNRWFCSELVFEAAQVVGIDLLERIPSSQVTPFDLLTSPLLIECVPPESPLYP